MTDPRDTPLDRFARRELAEPALPDTKPFVDAIRSRFGGVAAVLFYGSCLRRGESEGVLDFYALVDDYRGAYDSRGLALANRLLPPNVFYLERSGLRAKVAVVSMTEFLARASGRRTRPFVWARFSQPFRAPYVRDDAARSDVARAAALCLRTATLRGLELRSGRDGNARFSDEEFFTTLFRETYASELRAERDATVRGLFARDPARYAAALDAALDTLAAERRLSHEREGAVHVVRDARGLLSRPRRGRRHVARIVGVAQLLKTAFTFGDWMPYALWKLERHTGHRLEPSERQRRHPLLFAWPLVFRALARRSLR